MNIIEAERILLAFAISAAMVISAMMLGAVYRDSTDMFMEELFRTIVTSVQNMQK